MSPNLCHLEIDVVSTNNPVTLHFCLKLVAEAFPLLQSLKFTREGDLVNGGDARDAHLGHEDLTPLTSMNNLVWFQLRYLDPVFIKNEELTALLSKMPSLEGFELNQSPPDLRQHRSTSMSSQCLLALAQDCGIYYYTWTRRNLSHPPIISSSKIFPKSGLGRLPYKIRAETVCWFFSLRSCRTIARWIK